MNSNVMFPIVKNGFPASSGMYYYYIFQAQIIFFNDYLKS